MALDLVSNTFRPDTGTVDPKFAPIYDYKPPVDLSVAKNFTSGQPFEAFHKMRENAPVMWHPMEGAAGFWALTGYHDIQKVNKDAKTFSSQMGGILMAYAAGSEGHPLLHRSSLDAMINLDPPYHMQLRREHMAFFVPGFVAELKKKVERKVTALLDDMEKRGPKVDMVESFSAELPLYTLSEILGIPEADRPKVVHWMHYLEAATNTIQEGELGALTPEAIKEFLDNIEDMFAYGQYILKERRKNPQNDLLSAIANVEIDGEVLADEYLDGSWLLIIFAGNDTTRNTLSGTMKLLTENPDQKQKLIDNPDLIPNMVHEAIRVISPVMYMRRTATEDTQIGEQKIGAGEKVLMYFGAGNHDPSVFTDPDRFDVERANAKNHIAFGIGPHVCIGQRVANMQLDAAYRQILSRFPKIHWTGDINIAPNNFVHAISSLGVDLGR